ncbi:MAG: hypothetical protein LBT70_03015 [Holosporaceae bacterium]|jgi:hypothetical protein|nr:hypothetical protein [Holosporaceae bacterium]
MNGVFSKPALLRSFIYWIRCGVSHAHLHSNTARGPLVKTLAALGLRKNKLRFYGSLALASVLLIANGTYAAEDNSPTSEDTPSTAKNKPSIAKDKPSVPANQSKSNLTPDLLQNLPFSESAGKVANDDVAGIRVVGDKFVLLGYGKNCSMEPFALDESFSDLNFFKRFPKLLSAEFTGIELTKDRLENIQKFLQKDIQNLVIDGCDIKPEYVELLADIVKKRTTLKNVTFRLIDILPESINVLLGALSDLSELKTICLAFDEIDKESCEGITHLIKSSAETLRNLSLAWSKILSKEEEGEYHNFSEAIGELKNLKLFELCMLQINEKETVDLFAGIRHLTSLIRFKLFLGNISIQNEVKLFENAESLGDALKDMAQLMSLDLSGMKLPKDVMQVLAQNVGYLKKLKYLDISNNSIDKETAEILADSFKENEELRTLIINSCGLTAQTFSSLVKNLNNAKISILYARDNLIKEGIKGLPVKNMIDLQLIDFSKNELDFATVMEFIKLTAEHPRLQAVNLGENSAIDDMDPVDKKIKRNDLENWKRENKSYTAFLGL